MKSVGLFRILKWKRESRMNQYIMAVLVSFPTLTYGMVMGWVSPALPLLQDPEGPLGSPMSDYHLSWMASVTFLTAIPLMLVAGFVADRYGRKITIVAASLSVAVCWLIKLAWIQSETIILARAISGIGNAVCYVVTPLYIMEISDDSIRGALGSMLILSQNMGFVISYICGDVFSFNAVLWISFVLPVIHLLLFWSAPESPAYLVKRGKIEEATEVMSWLKSADTTDKRVSEEIDKLLAETNNEKVIDVKLPWKLLVSDKTALKAFGICATILLIQECCGYMILLTYASDVFNRANVGSNLTSNKQAIVLGFVQLLGSIVATSLVERIGRKPLLASMAFSTGVGMAVLGTWFYLASVGVNAPGWLPISAMCLSIFSTAAGFQPTPFVILPEMFSFQLRGFVSSPSVALTAVADFAQTESYASLTKAIGPHGTFWMFAVICFFGFFFTIFFVPETKNRSLDEIYQVLSPGRRKVTEL